MRTCLAIAIARIRALFRRNAPEKCQVIAVRSWIEAGNIMWQSVRHRGDPTCFWKRPSLMIRYGYDGHIVEFAIKRRETRQIEPPVQCGECASGYLSEYWEMQNVDMKMENVETVSELTY